MDNPLEKLATMNPRHPLLLTSVVAATDFSAACEQAAALATLIAHEHGVNLHLVHVTNSSLLDDLRHWLDNSQQWQARMEQQTQQRLQDQARALHAQSGVAIQTHLLSGQPVQDICAHTADLQAGLLVVGARGEHTLHHRLVGSTAERLLRKTRVPLLLVRQSPELPYERVLVPLDFSPWSEDAMVLARQVAPGAHLVLMHSFTIPFEEKLRFAGVDEDTLGHYRERARVNARDHLMALVDRHKLESHDYTLSLSEGDAPLHIIQQAQERGCDLIVIGKHGRQAAEELLLGSVTTQVLTQSACDVLVSTRHRD